MQGSSGALILNITVIMADPDSWQGGEPPGCIFPYSYKGHKIGWRFQIKGNEAKKLPRDVPRSKQFSFEQFGEGAEAAAKAYQRQIAEDHGLEIKNQYRYREDPRDGLPYIEFHIRNTAGEDHYPMCDATNADLQLLEDHIWYVHSEGNNIYVATNAIIDGKMMTMKRFHSFKHPEWPIVDHYSEIPEENRNGLDNRSKHLRDGSGGVNEYNRRLQKNNTSGANGVCYDNTNAAWRVYMTTNGVRSPDQYFHGPADKTHSSYMEACACARKLAADIGNMNGR